MHKITQQPPSGRARIRTGLHGLSLPHWAAFNLCQAQGTENRRVPIQVVLVPKGPAGGSALTIPTVGTKQVCRG